MTRATTILVSGMLCVLCACSAGQGAQPLVAVVWDSRSDLITTLAPLVEADLMADEARRLVDRENVARLLDEHRTGMRGLTSGQKGIQLGTLCAADVVILITEDLAVDPQTHRPELLGLHLQMFEVASTLKLLDATIAAGKDAQRAHREIVRRIGSAIDDGWRKWPVKTKGVAVVAVSETKCGGWDRKLFPGSRAFPNLLSTLLLKSDRVALLERRSLGSSAFERFVANVSPPVAAAVVVETTMRRTREGQTAVQTVVRGRKTVTLPEVVCDEITLDVISRQARAVLETLDGDAALPEPLRGLREEAENLFLRAYVLTRNENMESAYELAQSSLILAPTNTKAQVLCRRIYAKLLWGETKRWSKLSPDAQSVLIEEVKYYISSYFRGARTWFDESYELLVGSTEVLEFGEPGDGYELGSETLHELRSFIRRDPRLAEVQRKEKRAFDRAYGELIERTRDPRLMHRPSAWSFFGPERLYSSLQGMDDDGEFLATAKRYYEYETGLFKWDRRMSAHVKGYSARLWRTPRIVVERYKGEGGHDWRGLDNLCRWLGGQPDPLAAVWRTMMILGLKDLSPLDSWQTVDSEALQDELLRHLLLVGNNMTRDGCLDRRFGERRDLLARCAGGTLQDLPAEYLLKGWETAKSLQSDMVDVAAVAIVRALLKRGEHELVGRIVTEALGFMPPGSNGYDEIVACKRKADLEIDPSSGAARIWHRAEKVFSSRPEGAVPSWGGFSMHNGTLCFRDARAQLVFAVAVERGSVRKHDYSSLSAAAGGSRSYGSTWDGGTVCAGTYWFPLRDRGLIGVDLRTGETKHRGSASGLYSDRIFRITSVGGRLYGVAYGPYTASSTCWTRGRSRPFVLFELDPATGAVRNLDGSGSESGRMAGSNSIRILDILGDEEKNGIWVMETWGDLHFPHFYDLKTGEWIRIRINAFQWQLFRKRVSLRRHTGGILLNRYLYEPDHDRLSFLPYFAGVDAGAPQAAEIDLRMPVTGWHDQVWGVSSDGRLARVSRDGNSTEYGERFLAEGMKIHQLYQVGEMLTIVAVGPKSLDVWRIEPVKFEGEATPPRLQATQQGKQDKRPLLRPATDPVDRNGAVMPDLRAVADPSHPDLAVLAPGSPAAYERQLASVSSTGLPLEVRNESGISFRLVPAGSYVMGNIRGSGHYGMWRAMIERPVTFTRPLYVGKYEITQGQWERVMGDNPIRFGEKRGDLPMDEVSWPMCKEFLRRLCKAEGVAPGTYRLLSEAEWEYASRAGTETFYCFGDVFDRTLANVVEPGGVYPDTSFRRRSIPPVQLPGGSYSPNAWGLHDMHGSVIEWCLDKYWWRYPAEPVTDPVPREDGWKRVYRGGNRHSTEGMDASSYFCDFARVNPETRARGFGFRIARQLERGKERGQ